MMYQHPIVAIIWLVNLQDLNFIITVTKLKSIIIILGMIIIVVNLYFKGFIIVMNIDIK